MGTRVNTQEKFIDDARRLLKPAEVKLHKIPTWLSVRLRAYRRANELSQVPLSMLVQTIGLVSDDRWLDHWGACVSGPFVCCHKHKVLNFVSEPYDFGSETARSVDRFCERLGNMEWHVSSNTWWYPGSTVRITIHETSKE